MRGIRVIRAIEVMRDIRVRAIEVTFMSVINFNSLYILNIRYKF
jgi:hypothetical protein